MASRDEIANGWLPRRCGFSKEVLRAAIGQQTPGPALLNHGNRSGTAQKGRMNRAIPCPPSSTSRPSNSPVTPEVAGSSPVAPVSEPPACRRFRCPPRAAALTQWRVDGRPLLAAGQSSLCGGEHGAPTRDFDGVCSGYRPPQIGRTPDLDAERVERSSVGPEALEIGSEDRWDSGAPCVRNERAIPSVSERPKRRDALSRERPERWRDGQCALTVGDFSSSRNHQTAGIDLRIPVGVEAALEVVSPLEPPVPQPLTFVPLTLSSSINDDSETTQGGPFRWNTSTRASSATNSSV